MMHQKFVWRWLLFCGTAVLLITILQPAHAQISNPGLLITEVFYNPPGEESEREWIEIANVGTAVLDLSDIKVGDEEQSGGGEGMRRFPEGTLLEPEQAVVVAQTAVGFRFLTDNDPDFELTDSDPNVPDMRNYLLWATGDIALANDGDEIVLLNKNNFVIDSVNYGDRTTFFAPAVTAVFEGQSIERNPANCDTDTATDWQPQQQPTPSTVQFDDACRAPLNPAELEELPPIGAIQGGGEVAAAINQTVTFRGIVTGVYEDRNTSGTTFYTAFVQDIPGFEDGDPMTSDGIALFLGRERPFFQTGDQIRVSGLVTEFFGLTELDDNNLDIQVELTDQPLPEPILIDPPAGAEALAAYFEPLEGMRVQMANPARVVGPTFSSCGFAVVSPTVDTPRIFRRALADSIGQVVPILYQSDQFCDGFPHVKTGDLVSGLVGPLTYNFDQFKIVQQAGDELAVTSGELPQPPTAPTLGENQISIASFNMENYFDLIDDTGDDSEPKPLELELSLKQQKLAAALTQTLNCPALVAVQEVEKGTLLDELALLAASACGFTYAVTHLESADVRGIDLALMSNPNLVMVQSARLMQTCTVLETEVNDVRLDCPAGQDVLFSRPPLMVKVLVEERPFTIIVNHFKSKRGGEAETAPWRLAQANHVAGLVTDILADDPAANVVVLGDFNDYEQSPPLLALTENGNLENVLLRLPDDVRYSFVFGGVSQLIDGILLSPALQDAVADVMILHVNADYPDALSVDVSPEALPFKTTDHDLPLLILELADLPAPEPGSVATAVPNPDPSPTPINMEPIDHPDDIVRRRMGWLIGGLALLIGGVGTTVFLIRRRN
ncbi:lamin tail domain-containing protein [Candidatus Leptofilum sp.]|uniref:endonuclease/exonuclease/phosphatase family protein n=1 Tax=Candidatus Leptofilum sp. TaxID=3241576 RepID=UPI003B58BF8C